MASLTVANIEEASGSKGKSRADCHLASSVRSLLQRQGRLGIWVRSYNASQSLNKIAELVKIVTKVKIVTIAILNIAMLTNIVKLMINSHSDPCETGMSKNIESGESGWSPSSDFITCYMNIVHSSYHYIGFLSRALLQV